jgi:hypothetical protein
LRCWRNKIEHRQRAQVLRGEFLEVLAWVPNPRDPRVRRCSRTALLAIEILATAAWMRGYAGFASRAPRRVQWLVTVDAMYTQIATAKLICTTVNKRSSPSSSLNRIFLALSTARRSCSASRA